MFRLCSQLVCVFYSIVVLSEFSIVLEYHSINDYYLNFRLVKKPLLIWVLSKPSLICFPIDLSSHNLPCLNIMIKDIWLNLVEFLFLSIFSITLDQLKRKYL